jgi:hypothetical protein
MDSFLIEKSNTSDPGCTWIFSEKMVTVIERADCRKIRAYRRKTVALEFCFF